MNYEQIAALLEKYWEGETSLEEDRRLKGYFASGAVDERLQPVAPLFQMLRHDQAQQYTGPARKPRLLTFSSWRSWAVAASVVGLLLMGWLCWEIPVRPADPAAGLPTAGPGFQNDTYEDPEKAAAEIKAALALVSSKLNKGKKAAAKGLKKMEKVDKYMISPNHQ